MKPEFPPSTEDKKVNLENIKKEDITPETFKKYFPLIINDSITYARLRYDLDSAINKSFSLKINNDKDYEELKNKEKEYLDVVVSSYENGSFSNKVDVIDFIETSAFIPVLYKEKLHESFRHKLVSKEEDWLKRESKPYGNYFLHLYLSSFSEKEDNENTYSSQNYKLASSNQYIEKNSLDHDGLAFSKTEDKEKIESLFKKVNDLTKDNKWETEETSKEELFECFDQLGSFFHKFSTKELHMIEKGDDEKTEIQDLLEYSIFLNDKVRNVFKKEFNVSLADLSIPEQFAMIGYIKNSTNESIANKKEFAKQYGVNGLRTFLSIEQGGKEMGDKIINLGEKLPEETAKKVFTKYGEIIDSVNKAEEEVKKLYEKESVPNEVFISVKESLLKKGAELLTRVADDLENDEELKEENIIKKLENVKISSVIMGQSYVELHKQGIKVPIEEIKNTTIEKISANDLSETVKKEIVDVYEKGRPEETYENKEHIKLLKDEFEKTLNNKDTFVFNIRFNNEIVAFATFYKESEDTLHIGGLTFIDDVRNPAIGNAVMVSIMNEFKDFNIKALVHSKNKVLAMYQKRFGFEIVKELPLEENAGELYYEIERPKNKSIVMEGRQKLEAVA
jgi:hypothetical protein